MISHIIFFINRQSTTSESHRARFKEKKEGPVAMRKSVVFEYYIGHMLIVDGFGAGLSAQSSQWEKHNYCTQSLEQN